MIWIENFGPMSNFDDKLFEIKHKSLKKVFNNSSNHKNSEIQVGNRLQYIKKILNGKKISVSKNNETVNINYWISYKKNDLIEKSPENIFKIYEITKIKISNKIFKKNVMIKFINEENDIGFGIILEIILKKLGDIELIFFKVEILELME
jgi:hypothetical protein